MATEKREGFQRILPLTSLFLQPLSALFEGREFLPVVWSAKALLFYSAIRSIFPGA